MDQGAEKPESTPAQAERRSREAAALRANLKRRKQQARDRSDQPLPTKADPELTEA